MPNIILANSDKQIIVMDIQWSDLSITRYKEAVALVSAHGGFPAGLDPEHFLSYAAYIQRIVEDKKLVDIGEAPAIPPGYAVVGYDKPIPTLPSIYSPALTWSGDGIVVDMDIAREAFVSELNARVSAGYLRIKNDLEGAEFAGDAARVTALSADMELLRTASMKARAEVSGCKTVDDLLRAWPSALGA